MLITGRLRLGGAVGTAVAIAAMAPPAVAGTYSFSAPATAVTLGAFEQNTAGVYRLAAPACIGTQTTGSPGFANGSYGRAWLSLPGGAAFTQLAGTVKLGSVAVNTSGALTGSVLIRSGAGLVSSVWSHAITPNYPSYAWTYNGAATRPGSVGLQLAATAAGICGTCGTEIAALSGTVDDGQAPSAASISSPIAGQTTRDRAVQVAWSVTDVAAGPGNVFLAINGQRQPTPLRPAPPADTTRIPGQRFGGRASPARSGPGQMPEASGSANLSAHRQEA